MTTNSHFRASAIGDLHQMSMVEARYQTIEGTQHRPGTTGMTPGGRQTVDAYNSWYAETADRERELATPILRAQSNMGPDYKPIRGSELYGVQASSLSPDSVQGARGLQSTPLMRGDSVRMPDRRDSFGHNTKNRFDRVRG